MDRATSAVAVHSLGCRGKGSSMVISEDSAAYVEEPKKATAEALCEQQYSIPRRLSCSARPTALT